MKTKKSILTAFSLLMLLLTFSAFKSVKEEVIVIKTSVVCDMCKERIERNLPFEKGIKEVVVDVEAKTITVHYRPDKTTPEKIRTAISKLGYRADDVPANPEDFEKLPDCCKAEGCGK